MEKEECALMIVYDFEKNVCALPRFVIKFALPLWPHGQSVKTEPSQGSMTGSTPVGVTK